MFRFDNHPLSDEKSLALNIDLALNWLRTIPQTSNRWRMNSVRMGESNLARARLVLYWLMHIFIQIHCSAVLLPHHITIRAG